MKKLSIVIFWCILAIGIAANANIKRSEDKIDHANNSKVQSVVETKSDTQASTSDPKTIGFLLGVGIVGIVTFSRRT